MASYNSDVYTNQLTPGTAYPTARILPWQNQGKERHLRAKITIPATIATGEYIYLGKVPRGAVVIPEKVTASCNLTNTALTVTMGDTEASTPDDDKYIASFDIKGAGVNRPTFTSAAVPVGITSPTPIEADGVVLFFKTTGTTTVGASTVLVVDVPYILE